MFGHRAVRSVGGATLRRNITQSRTSELSGGRTGRIEREVLRRVKAKARNIGDETTNLGRRSIDVDVGVVQVVQQNDMQFLWRKVRRNRHHASVFIHVRILDAIHVVGLSTSNRQVILATSFGDSADRPTSIGGLLVPTDHRAIERGGLVLEFNLTSGDNGLASASGFIEARTALLNSRAKRPRQILQLEGRVGDGHVQRAIREPTTKQRIGRATANLVRRGAERERVLGQGITHANKLVASENQGSANISKKFFCHEIFSSLLQIILLQELFGMA